MADMRQELLDYASVAPLDLKTSREIQHDLIAIAKAGLTRRQSMPPGFCTYCDKYRHEDMMPPHDASERCESGKHNHCTCDTCF